MTAPASHEQVSSKPRGLQKPTSLQKQPKQVERAGLSDSPILGEDASIDELKNRHEKLVDMILEEEDELISAHEKFIENTINSGKVL